MSVWHQLSEVTTQKPTVVTVGNFDGVHRGHQLVLARSADVARHLGDVSVIAVTFDPHPLQELAPTRAPLLLTGLPQRAELLTAAGADHVLALPFDRGVASWTPPEFVTRVLVETLHAAAVVVGADFRFGARAAGDVAALRAAGDDWGFDTHAVEIAAGEQTFRWSSSVARAAVASGDVAAAGQVLGRDHAVRGAVVEGDRRGRQLGYPTANVAAPPWIAIPADGVYAGTLRRTDQQSGAAVPAAISVGTNPTFAGASRRVEAYVLDRDDLALYGVEVEVAFREFLRPQVRFDDVAQLTEQMARDVEHTRAALSGRRTARQ
ncbi:MAG: bifunctional riboflavin kinase/FAD synthetase [Nocardioidaceae bacterium]|nr:bifunctional riboflavin kinase/FAD synthetase [Nocardioidaceae bacterium]MDQ3325960.1 bifunctional riboflavin kinase/FAD synthetase [Actinomycetota bacterium]